MASTHKTEETPSKADQKAAEKPAKELTQLEALTAEIEKFYGVELEGKDYDKLIRDANDVAVNRPTSYKVGDPVLEAQFSEKLGHLRDLVERDADESDHRQAASMREWLEDTHVEGVGLSFPTADSFRITSGGKEDTGHIDVTKEAFLQAVSRIKGGAQL